MNKVVYFAVLIEKNSLTAYLHIRLLYVDQPSYVSSKHSLISVSHCLFNQKGIRNNTQFAK